MEVTFIQTSLPRSLSSYIIFSLSFLEISSSRELFNLKTYFFFFTRSVLKHTSTTSSQDPAKNYLSTFTFWNSWEPFHPKTYFFYYFFTCSTLKHTSSHNPKTKNDLFTSSTTCCERVRCLLLEIQKIKTGKMKSLKDHSERSWILTEIEGGVKVTVLQHLPRTKSSFSSLSFRSCSPSSWWWYFLDEYLWRCWLARCFTQTRAVSGCVAQI